jgi:two-component system, chemotaxis family, CheB/CheR fusion protein
MGFPKGEHGGRDNPLNRLRSLGADQIGPAEFSELLHEIEVHQEELSAQNAQLSETQHALEESRDRYVDLYDFAPIGFMTLNESGIIREINLTGAALLRKERNRIVGLPFNAFVTPGDKSRLSEHLRQCRQIDRSTTTVELRLNTVTPALWVQLLTRRHGPGADGRSGLLTAIIDISERKRLEQQQREAEEAREKLARDREIARARVDAKDHFLAILSHELRTPLTPIVATLSDARLLALAPEPLRGALQRMRRNLDLEVRLIDDLLDVTRISRDRLILARERVNVHVVVDEVVELLAYEMRSRGVQVVTSFDAPTEWVIGDSTRLRQVFWNLIGNAIKFSSPGGRVTVMSAAGSQGSIQVSVNDAGEGMDEAVVASINERGETPSTIPLQAASGLGLGLAICRGVVTAHGGTLRAMSEGKGHGSTFVVQIPIAAHLEPWDQPIEPAGANRTVPSRPRRILLVEDHQDSADTLSQLLTFHDYDVSVARTMEEAITVANQVPFDLLISDIRLPDGSGLDLMRRLQSDRPIRGIAISGFGTEQDQRRSREAGYETHLTKPLDFNVLLGAIERVDATS